MIRRSFRLGVTLGLLGCLAGGAQAADPSVSFNRDIRPLLSDKCYTCHGPDENQRKAGLRFDTRQGMLHDLGGYFAVVARHPEKSELIQRIHHSDPDERMPPAESKQFLTAEQKKLLETWIRQGAVWEDHWSLIPPTRPPLPTAPADRQVHNAVDNFILARLNTEGIQPAPPAGRERLLRRVTMDLTGLPPSLAEIDAFLADDSPDAFARVVDRLLQSDALAERLAMDWMDVARYADSHGMHADGWRMMWPWRDWVLQAFKDNMPYDRFVTWQLAGDLLPSPTREQVLATGFHRNHPMTAEGGVIDEEFRMLYVFDRVQTTATAFLGLTLECARCHDHKFDPIRQKEYYQMAAFFNNLKELGMTGDDGNYGPMMMLLDEAGEAKLKRLDAAIAALQEKQGSLRAALRAEEDLDDLYRRYPLSDLPDRRAHFPLDDLQEVKVKDDKTEKRVDGELHALPRGKPTIVDGRIGKAFEFHSEYDFLELREVGLFEVTDPYSAGVWIFPEQIGTLQSVLCTSGSKNDFWRGWDFFLDESNHLAIQIIHAPPHNYLDVRTSAPVATNQWTHVLFSYDGSGSASGLQLYVNGRPAATRTVFDRLSRSIHPVRHDPKRSRHNRPIRVAKSYRGFTGANGVYRGRVDDIRIFDAALTAPEAALVFHRMQPLTTSLDLSDGITDDSLFEHYLVRHHQEFKETARRLAELRKERLDYVSQAPEVMVMEEMPAPRSTHVLKRGQYDAPEAQVAMGTPARVLAFPENLPRNRLGLARWLFHPDNPLTARVTVNRYWQMMFGRGLVKTTEDFGSQGEWPTHPELLDWLAVTFRDSGWNVKELIRLMALSATYQASSQATPEQLNQDPENRLLARGSTYRLPAEMIRDHALAASGLLVRTLGGPSVKPYQPEGLWIEKGNFSAKLLHYKPDSGPKLYRRSLYTFIRRTSPHPAMTAFDAPNRDVCTVRREQTSTPLQALVLMNDPQFLEAARAMAEKLQRERYTLQDQLILAVRLLTGRHPSTDELTVLEDLHHQELERFREDAKAAESLMKVGESPRDESLNLAETAALAMVANTLMNHNEFYTKR